MNLPNESLFAQWMADEKIQKDFLHPNDYEFLP